MSIIAVVQSYPTSINISLTAVGGKTQRVINTGSSEIAVTLPGGPTTNVQPGFYIDFWYDPDRSAWATSRPSAKDLIANDSTMITNLNADMVDGKHVSGANGSGEITTNDGSQTLTNKTLTAPTINDGNLNLDLGTLVVPQGLSLSPIEQGSIGVDTITGFLRMGNGVISTTLLDGESAQFIEGIKSFSNIDINGGTIDGITSLAMSGISVNNDLGDVNLTARTFISDTSTGVPPLTVASTTLVSNLNAELFGGAKLSIDGSLADNSNLLVPTQQAVRAAIEGISLESLDAVPTTRTINGYSLLTDITLTKTDIGLSEVTNDAQVMRSEMGTSSGVATLTSTGTLVLSQLPDSVARLTSTGVLLLAQLPSVAITNTYLVTSTGEMLALNAEVGSIAVRTDVSKTYILQVDDPSVEASWVEILASAFTATLTTDIEFIDADDLHVPSALAVKTYVDNHVGTSTGGVIDINGPGDIIFNTVLGTDAFADNTTGYNNTAIGYQALHANNTGYENTAVGYNALKASVTSRYNTAIGAATLPVNTIGAFNTAIGAYVLYSNTTGSNNTSVGYYTLNKNTTGTNNTAVGSNALYNNTANEITAIGANTLYSNTTGTNNTAVGCNALFANTTGVRNTGIGANSLESNTTGMANVGVGDKTLQFSTATNCTAVGSLSLWKNTNGNNNTAIGANSLSTNTTGANNAALGTSSLSGNITGSQNTALGYGCLATNEVGDNNTAVGYGALFTNKVSANTAVGYYALNANTTGTNNTAVGYEALKVNTEGSCNTAVGFQALNANTTGIHNTAVGYSALKSNTVGSSNTALGRSALMSNVTGSSNVAIGSSALVGATEASFNTAIGHNVMQQCTTGNSNTAVGMQSMQLCTTGCANTSVGYNTLSSVTTGQYNTAIGYAALSSSTENNNVALGYNAGGNITTGANNTLLGAISGAGLTTGSNNTIIGYNATASTATVSNEITLGNSSIATLRCQVQTITALSDERDKANIADASLGLDFINALKIRQFNWDKREWYLPTDENGLTDYSQPLSDVVKDGSKVQPELNVGVIAQELKEVQSAFGAEYLKLVYESNPEKLEATFGNILPVVVKAIQELSAKVDILLANK